MRGRKPIVAADNVVAGPFAGPGVVLAEPDWLTAFPDGDGWGAAAAALAAARWHGAVADMTRLRTLGPENAAALEILAVNYARWRLAEAHVAMHGPIVPAPRTGVPMHSPYLAVANGAAEKVLKIEAELGLPPSMRGRVGRAEAAKKAPTAADRFLGSQKATSAP